MANISSLNPLIGEFHLDHDALNKRLEAFVQQRIKQDTGFDGVLKNSNVGGWHSNRELHAHLGDGSAESNQLLLLFESLTGPMNTYIRSHAEKFKTVPKESYDWNYTGAWYNVAFEGSYNAPHAHPGSQISAAYYIRTEEPNEKHPFSGRIDFIQNNIQYPYFPKPGTLLLFPSDLLHWVHPYYGKEIRICLSFNANNIK